MEDESNQTVALRQFVDGLMHAEAWAEAITLLENSPQLVRLDFALTWTLGWAHFKLGRFERAHSVLQDAVTLAPGEYAGYVALGVILRSLGQLKAAEEALQTAIKFRDTDWARLSLALTYLDTGRLDDAEQVHVEGLRSKPESAERWAAYADFLSDIGRDLDAADAGRRAAALES